MNISKITVLVFIFLSILSCSTKKDVLYLQDFSKNSVIENYSFIDYKVKIDDILKIDVYADNPQAALEFNPNALQSNINNSRESLLYNGYQVNKEGSIFFPSLGEINVLNKTVDQIREMIYKTLIQEGFLVNPSVDVKLLDTHFTILGEVNKPGRYTYLKNNFSILEAIGMAGDLTINGERDNILLLRESKSKRNIIKIDITSSEFISEEGFQVLSGDIIIVNPNSTRIKNAGVIGNSGTLLSLLSFILSSIIVINN